MVAAPFARMQRINGIIPTLDSPGNGVGVWGIMVRAWACSPRGSGAEFNTACGADRAR